MNATTEFIKLMWKCSTAGRSEDSSYVNKMKNRNEEIKHTAEHRESAWNIKKRNYIPCWVW